ncbi:MAG: aspartate 1-decarboxylase [Oscillospiraceae bacterium]|nr:aspartate 1-decarboxylase [Oscillospiraceae bacterium]
MVITVLKSKIHRAVVTQAELDYIGSITIDKELMDAAGVYEYEKVHIANINTGARFETYVITGDKGSGVICLNGAAARYVQVNDKIIIMAYAQMTPEEAASNPPKVVFVTDDNKIANISRNEERLTVYN